MKLVEGLVLVALGAGASWLCLPRASTPAAPPPREVVRERIVSAPRPYVSTPEAPRLSVEPRAANPVEPDRATTIVREAVARREWSAADREALRAEMDALPGEVQAELVAQLAAAVNRGEVRITMDDPPL
jgi:hypothetical protein